MLQCIPLKKYSTEYKAYNDQKKGLILLIVSWRFKECEGQIHMVWQTFLFEGHASGRIMTEETFM